MVKAPVKRVKPLTVGDLLAILSMYEATTLIVSEKGTSLFDIALQKGGDKLKIVERNE